MTQSKQPVAPTGWTERTIERLFPAWALRRSIARVGLEHARSFDAAKIGRRTAGWTAVPVAAEIIRRVAPLMGLRPKLEPPATDAVTAASN